MDLTAGVSALDNVQLRFGGLRRLLWSTAASFIPGTARVEDWVKRKSSDAATKFDEAALKVIHGRGLRTLSEAQNFVAEAGFRRDLFLPNFFAVEGTAGKSVRLVEDYNELNPSSRFQDLHTYPHHQSSIWHGGRLMMWESDIVVPAAGFALHLATITGSTDGRVYDWSGKSFLGDEKLTVQASNEPGEHRYAVFRRTISDGESHYNIERRSRGDDWVQPSPQQAFADFYGQRALLKQDVAVEISAKDAGTMFGQRVVDVTRKDRLKILSTGFGM